MGEGVLKMSNNGWIGVDLDGTLAEYHGWINETHIGKPIHAMVNRVRKWLAEGKEVRVFTARVYYNPEDGDTVDVPNEGTAKTPDQRVVVTTIQDWCKLNIGVILPITCTKDYGMIELWDDRCVRVVSNTGERCCGE